MDTATQARNQTADGGTPQQSDSRGSALCSWIMTRVEAWRAHRDRNHKSDWDRFYRAWRGQFDATDASRKSERSKIVTPVTMQAVDATVAEIEEAIFGREAWVDVSEDVKEKLDPEQQRAMTEQRDLLLELMEAYNVPTAISNSIVLGTVFGTGIAKINTYEEEYRGKDGEKQKSLCVELVPVEPYAFVPDPTTASIEDMLGMAHEVPIPLHVIRTGQKQKRYRQDVKVEPLTQVSDSRLAYLDLSGCPIKDAVMITEWHGKVPAAYLASYMDPEDPLLQEPDEDAELELVEAIVTIANDSVVLSAKANPFHYEDRCFVAYQHDLVPGYFWGRGVPEKADNPQRGLDATVRARIDALGIVAHPMVAGDTTRLPRGMNLAVWPGKFWPTTGNPNDVLTGINLGQINPAMFDHAGDMERMVQTATGAMDPGASYSPENQGGATNTALARGAFVKRARRTMQNIERSFLRPAVRKILWRYIQFDPENFTDDYDFTVTGTMGIMAREFEQQQLTQLLSLVPNESKPFMALLKAIFDNSSSPHKAEVLSAVNEMLNPPENPEAQERAKQVAELEMRQLVASVDEAEAKAAKTGAEVEAIKAKATKTAMEADALDEDMANEQIKHAIDLREVQAFEEQNKISMVMTQLRGIETAIKAIQAQIQLEKVKSEGKNLASIS